MTDDEILEQRAYLRETIDRLDREWDEYRKNYAGVPEYWEVQRNAYNEISALQSHLASLPLTSEEKRWRLIKVASIMGVVIAAVVLIWTLKDISLDISSFSIFTWKAWLITSSIIAIVPAAGFVLYKRNEDGFFDVDEFWPAAIYAILAFMVLVFLRLLFSPDFSNMTFQGWTGWGLKSLWLSLVPALSYLGYMFLEDELDSSDEWYTGFGFFILTFLGLTGLKVIWWLISLVL